MKPKKVNVLKVMSSGIWLPIFLWLSSSFQIISGNGVKNETSWESERGKVIPVLYDSTGVDGHLESDLAKTVFLSMEILGKGLAENQVKPLFVDLGKWESGSQDYLNIFQNHNIVISLLESEKLISFVKSYEKVEKKEKKNLYVYTPRSLWKPKSVGGLNDGVVIKSLQMSEEAKAVALLHRVNKVGVKTLIPVLDSDNSEEQDYQLNYYAKLVRAGFGKGLKLMKPIYLSNSKHEEDFRKALGESANFNQDHLRRSNFANQSITVDGDDQEDLKPGILLLAKNGSRVAMAIAEERKHLLLNWFSPNIIELDEWARDNGKMDNRIGEKDSGARVELAKNSLFGLYTVNFVGAKGWDNPRRRQVLRELATFTESSPKILLSILTYDAVKLGMSHLKNEKIPLDGLSGKIEFDEKTGFRKSGTYLGSSLVPNGLSNGNNATLLQPSFWILEDVVTLKQSNNKAISIKSHPKVTDYDVATSSILTKAELLKIVEISEKGDKCKRDHLMRIVVYDPFTQLPQRYFFTVENLPEVVVVPNHQGFGITFTCMHGSGDSENLSTLRLACTPGVRMSQPINCFKSYVATAKQQTRNKRDAGQKNGGAGGHVPSVQYQYGFASDPWNDGSNQYYYQGLKNRQDYQAPDYSGAGPPRTDVPIVDDPAPPPPPPPPASKLPELRQILKAAKPFVGSCIGSTTGCAMCVLVLGRLPLGTAPPACTGPCFVGTFGSCGSLLGRVFSETTVICTELFRQGLLDVETFVADAEFGKYMHNSSPYTMQGYTLLATPLVEQMKTSPTLTKIVAWFAIPWAHHMQYLLGRNNETNWVGSGIHLVGYPICNLSGRLYTFYLIFRHVYLPNLIVPFILTIILLLILSPAIVATTRNLNSSSSRSSTSTNTKNLFTKCKKEFVGMLMSGGGILNLNYFKAIGSKT